NVKPGLDGSAAFEAQGAGQAINLVLFTQTFPQVDLTSPLSLNPARPQNDATLHNAGTTAIASGSRVPSQGPETPSQGPETPSQGSEQQNQSQPVPTRTLVQASQAAVAPLITSASVTGIRGIPQVAPEAEKPKAMLLNGQALPDEVMS